VVATPGRLIDLIERKAIQLENIHYIVLDEADEMLNMGFREDIEFILQNTPKRQSAWLFSATMPSEVRQVSKRFMKEPFEITIGKVNATNTNIDHQYYVTSGVNRYQTLKRIVDFNPGIYGIIFTRTKADAQSVTESLIREGYDIEALHGDHRSGRTGRAGRSGVCVSLLTNREVYRLKQIERMVNNRFHKMDIPSGKDVCRKQFFHFIDKMLAADISHGEYETYLPVLQEKFAHVEKEEILQRVAALEFDRFLQYYENAADLNVREEKRAERTTFSRDRGDRGERTERGDRSEPRTRTFGRSGAGSGGNLQRLFVNLGTKDGFYKASFLQYILDMSDLKKEVLGRIDMKEMNSWVEVESGAANKMIKALDGKKFKGRVIRMNDAESGGGRTPRGRD
jgi:ATP-dependent RNA helicase DeaD